jgi:hypothetical protein
MRIFFACPLTGYLRSDGAPGSLRLDPGFATFLVRIEHALIEAGHEVFLAHRLERFGEALRPPGLCTPFDMLEMQRCDAVVAIPERSFGVHIELGWAAAAGKPMVLVHKHGEESSTPLLDGLDSIATCRVIRVEGAIVSSPAGQEELGAAIVAALVDLRPGSRRPAGIAFLSTAFGFGPVSKAASIARALKDVAPHTRCHFFGAGIDHDFASAAQAFDRLYKIDVDNREMLADLVPHLAGYDAVISLMNMDLLPLWRGDAPLYLVDSLAWMWPQLPAGIGNVERYFVQDYLLGDDRLAQWQAQAPVELVAPIESSIQAQPLTTRGSEASSRRLLVNLSGCANPLGRGGLYDAYAQELIVAIATAAGTRFDAIQVCCNARLAERLRPLLGADGRVRVDHVPHHDFLDLLVGSTLVLTTPGITTTLEALALGTPLRFLLPHNYSQALISERYRTLLGDRGNMAFSRFGADFVVPPGLAEDEGVARTLANLERILRTRADDLRTMVHDLVEGHGGDIDTALRGNIRRRWILPGQHTIAAAVLAGVTAKAGGRMAHAS